MPVPESQLDTWSHQGSITQSSSTYASIRNVLEDHTPIASRDFSVFLQGSYGNDTNIFRESDVDIVVRLNEVFQHDLEELDKNEKAAFDAAFESPAYTHVHFKADVLAALQLRYGQDVAPGDKAIAVKANGSRRKADVISAVTFRRYYRFRTVADQSYTEGICFYTASGTRIANYPKQHSENLTLKHQATRNWFKPTIRILKNLRSRLVEEKMIKGGSAPSYYLEGLLYNVPNECFGSSYQRTFEETVNWILAADRTKFVCANEQYYLLRPDSPVTWRSDDCDAFLNGAVSLWNQW